MNRVGTDFLSARSSFLMGVGSVLSICGEFHEYNESENPDDIAVAGDWRMVGQDIKDALDRAVNEVGPAPSDDERKQAA
jgi:hypothetical protein